MGFYASSDGFYIISTLDNIDLYKSLTKKGRIYTFYSIKIQKWWREVLKKKKRIEYEDKVIKIQRWWREVLQNEIRLQRVIKIQRWWRDMMVKRVEKYNEEVSLMFLVPLNLINNLIEMFRYIFGVIR